MEIIFAAIAFICFFVVAIHNFLLARENKKLSDANAYYKFMLENLK